MLRPIHGCKITVDDNFFSGGLYPGLSNYRYFEYQCIDTVKPFNGMCGTYGYNLWLPKCIRNLAQLRNT